ncbi:DUF2182 domain-containing protein [Pseudoalteromonas fenneropenaei]|uniref:DUF2182 domain-containing protein n=1 Tax=Pseudoalteromonas fenneropenaei TaxID=1737459 RepID=A0ABV7CF07_9GAMM
MALSSYIRFLSQPPLPILLLISAVAWGLLWAGGHNHEAHLNQQSEEVIHQHHQEASAVAEQHNHHHSAHVEKAPVEQQLFGWQVLSQLMGWTLMIVAMMFPLLHNAIRHIWQRSLPRLRFIGVALFCTVYLMLWMTIGVLCNLLLVFVQPVANWLVLSVGLLILLIWQSSPLKQWGLNYCHYTQRLALSGLAYCNDCIRYAVKKSFWCIVSCWHLMVYPMLFDSFSLMFGAMMLVCVWMFIEQHLSPRATHWSWPFRPELLTELIKRREVAPQLASSG